MNTPDTPTYVYEEEKPKHNATPLESAFAWICLISAYLFCRISPINDSPAGGFLFIIGLYAVTTVFLCIKKARFGVMPILAALSAVILSAELILSSNHFLHIVSYTYCLVTYMYYVYAALGNSLKAGFSDLVTVDYFKALVILPFTRFGALFAAIFSGKAAGKTVRRVLCGILLAIIPTAVVVGLLSYDDGFSELMDKLFDFDFNLWSHFLSFNLAIPLSAFGYGLFVAASENKCKDTITAESCCKTSVRIRIAPALTAAAATIPLLTVYVIFFISQWKYYLSGFTGVLPEGFVYSEYAREGFFQLCIVSVINLAVILLVMSFTKRTGKAESAVVKIISILYSLITLVLISTALAKMMMYINIYGLTPKRVYAAWLEIVLALIFLLVILKQFIPGFNVIITSAAVVVVCFSLLCLANTDSIIADYNVDRYLDGTLDSVDVEMLADLGDPAVPALVRLEKVSDEDISKQVGYRLDRFAEYYLESEEDENLFSYTIPARKARALLSDRTEAK